MSVISRGPANSAVPIPREPHGRDSSNQKIFLLEDDGDIAKLVRHNLEAAGYRVRSYSTQINFIADAQKERPSLMLLDIMVPGGDGLDLCRQVRQSGTILAATPIVFLTAKTSEADRILGLELGADDYITKPFSPRKLVERINQLLGQTVTERPATSP
jgi:DNA-binding response OmpR family regulator